MKKGCVLKNTESSEKVNALNVSWYYTWSTNGIQGCSVPFTPMVWGKNSDVPQGKNTVLILNEPDRPDQSNVSVQDAIHMWNSVQASRKGSPAVAANALTSPWFNDFMTQIKPDFICVHWYGPPHTSSLLSLVDGLYSKYGLPIWITEFSVAQWNTTKPMYTLNEVSQFMKDIVQELNKRSHVERYAWKTRDPSDPFMGTSALFDSDGNLTQLGLMYSQL